MNTNELTGAALDWAVAKCEGLSPEIDQCVLVDSEYYVPSEDWAQGGPIIEREGMDLHREDLNKWLARMWWDDENSSGDVQMYGPTPLIAAMRCYVVSKLGDTVEIPEELTK